MIAALLLLVATPQVATVTFTHPCAHSSVVLEAFGMQIGVTIKPTGSVLKDYFLVRFDSMPVEDAKRAIALALNATWTDSGGVLYLTRTRAQELAEESELRAGFRKAVDELIGDAKKEVAAQKPLSMSSLVEMLRRQDEEGATYWLDENSPSARLNARLTASLRTEDVLRLPKGVTTYSSRPGLDEAPLTPAWRQLYEEFRRECEIWSEATAAAGISEEDSNYFENHLGGPDEVASFQLCVEKASFSLDMEFQSEDSASSMGGGGAYAASMADYDWYGFYKDVVDPAKIDAETVNAWNSVDPNYDEMFGMWDRGASLFERKAPCALLKRIVSDTQLNEPLALLSSWPIIEVAAQKKTNIVALLPDDAIDWPFIAKAIKDGQPLSTVFDECYLPIAARYDSALRCWLAYPTDRPAARRDRGDRQAFNGLLATIARQDWLRLDDISGYVAKTGATSFNSGWAHLLGFAHDVDLSAQQGWDSSHFDLATRIYAAIPVAQRKAAWQGSIEVPIENWPPMVRGLLQDHDWGRERFNIPSPDPDIGETEDGRLIGAAIREGLPRGTKLVIKVEPQDDIWVGFHDHYAPMDLEQIAFNIVMPSMGEEFAKGFQDFAFGAREILEVRIEVPGVGTHELSDTFSRTPFKDEVRPLSQTPAAFQSALRQAVAKARGGH